MGTFLYSPILYNWYKWLDNRLPGTTKKIILKKVLIDQFLMTPNLLVVFFAGKCLTCSTRIRRQFNDFSFLLIRHVTDGRCERSVGWIAWEICAYFCAIVSFLVAGANTQFCRCSTTVSCRLRWNMCSRMGQHSLLGQTAVISTTVDRWIETRRKRLKVKTILLCNTREWD